MIAALLAALCLIGGAGLLYLTTPHQRLAAKPAGSGVRIGGGAALSAALILLLTIMGPASAVFTWMTGLMLLWSVPTVLVGWLRYRRENAR